MSSEENVPEEGTTTEQDTTLKTDDEKSGADSGNVDTTTDAKTDDDKADSTPETDDKKPEVTSPEPEYTPPTSEAGDDVKDNESKLADTEESKPTENQTMSEPSETPTNETAESTNQGEEQTTLANETEKADGDATQGATEATKTDDNATETGDVTKEATPEPTEPEPCQRLTTEPEVTDDKKETIVAGGSIEKEKLDDVIKDNEDLQDQLKSALSSQDTESESYKKLTEENAKLQKHHDDMKAKYEEMEGGHVLMQAEIETFQKVNAEQRDHISKLETEVRVLKESQGGDEVVKDLQEKLIRLSNEQEEKDKKVHSLEGELDSTKEKLKEAQIRAARPSTDKAQQSKTCTIM